MLLNGWIINFLKSVNTNSNIYAIELALEEIKKGKTISELLKKKEGYYLRIEELDTDLKYKIEFGCSPGPLVGDGGVWDVQFDKDGNVQSSNLNSQWIS